MLDKVKILKISEVPAKPVETAEKTFIKVLITPDEAPTYVMRVFELEPQAHIPEHKHPWEHEIYMLEGKVKVKVEDEEYVLEPETFIYIPPNKPHEYWNIGGEKARFICTIPNKPSV